MTIGAERLLSSELDSLEKAGDWFETSYLVKLHFCNVSLRHLTGIHRNTNVRFMKSSRGVEMMIPEGVAPGLVSGRGEIRFHCENVAELRSYIKDNEGIRTLDEGCRTDRENLSEKN